HRDTLSTRQYALLPIVEGRERFVDEPTMTLWPQLVITHGPKPPPPRRELAVATAGSTGIAGPQGLGSGRGVTQQQLAKVADVGELGPNVYRDLTLLPDSATYYFVVNVMNGRVNLAPSRFGIGQFNRTRYAAQTISHQLKTVSDDNQLIYIGPFNNYADAKRYETRILPLISDIMKIPGDLYNTFVITETNFGTLSDFDKEDDYHTVYQVQLDRRETRKACVLSRRMNSQIKHTSSKRTKAECSGYTRVFWNVLIGVILVGFLFIFCVGAGLFGRLPT